MFEDQITGYSGFLVEWSIIKWNSIKVIKFGL